MTGVEGGGEGGREGRREGGRKGGREGRYLKKKSTTAADVIEAFLKL